METHNNIEQQDNHKANEKASCALNFADIMEGDRTHRRNNSIDIKLPGDIFDPKQFDENLNKFYAGEEAVAQRISKAAENGVPLTSIDQIFKETEKEMGKSSLKYNMDEILKMANEDLKKDGSTLQFNLEYSSGDGNVHSASFSNTNVDLQIVDNGKVSSEDKWRIVSGPMGQVVFDADKK